MEETEEWRPVVGHEGAYEVSSLGRVRSVDRKIWHSNGGGHWHKITGRLLRPGRMNKFGHLSVAIGRGNSLCVHYLVAQAFICPRPAGQDVRHMNGDGSDNRLSNLQYASRSTNNRDRVLHGRCRLTVEQVIECRQRRAAGVSFRRLAADYGVSATHIVRITRGETYSHV